MKRAPWPALQVITPEQKLFAAGPARDSRFIVKDRWIECANFPSGHPEREVEFLHRQMNEEIDSLECSARALSDFLETNWNLRLCLARQCSDEARHALMFRQIMERRGGWVGKYPVLNFQYRIIVCIESLVGRLAVQNRSFEAGGIDAICYGIQDAHARGDTELAELYESQLSDEIFHVRFANEFINVSVKSDSRAILRIGSAMTAASKAFASVMGSEGTEGISYPADRGARIEAGFSIDEVSLSSGIAASLDNRHSQGLP